MCACDVVHRVLQRHASDDIRRLYVAYSLQSSRGHEKKNSTRELIERPPKAADSPLGTLPVMRSISGPAPLALSYKARVSLQMLADMHH